MDNGCEEFSLLPMVPGLASVMIPNVMLMNTCSYTRLRGISGSVQEFSENRERVHGWDGEYREVNRWPSYEYWMWGN